MSLDVVGVDDLEKHVHDLRLDERAAGHKLAIDAVQDRLQVVALAWVLAVKQLQEAADKVARDVLDDDIVAKVSRQDELEKQLVNKL